MRELLELETVQDKLGHLKNFIYDLEICILNVDQIISAQNEGVFLRPIDGFIGHYVFLVYSICAINCYKIFHEKEKRSFVKLFNQIGNCRLDKAFMNLFDENKIKDEDNRLVKDKEQLLALCKTLKFLIDRKAILIEKISNRRTKFYAHSDPDSVNFEKETLSDLKDLRDLAKYIYRQLDGHLYGRHFMFEVNIASIKPVLDDRKHVDDYYRQIEESLDSD